MQTPEKPKPKSLTERIAGFWKSPAAADAAKQTDEAVTKAIAKLTELRRVLAKLGVHSQRQPRGGNQLNGSMPPRYHALTAAKLSRGTTGTGPGTAGAHVAVAGMFNGIGAIPVMAGGG